MGKATACLRLPCSRVLLLAAALVLAGTGTAAPQATTGGGPTRSARAMTAHSLSPATAPDPEAPVAPRIMARYLSFEREFARDFGAASAAGARQEAAELQDIRRRLVARWGGTALFRFVAQSIKLYDRVEEAAQVERAGFRMGVEMDAVAKGQLGLRMQRVLE